MEIYRRVHDQEIANAIVDKLLSEGVDCALKVDQQVLDEIYVGSNPMGKQYCVKLKKEDFAKADQILQESDSMEEIPQDHYLLTFSDEELLEILAKPDEWSDFDYRNSRKILEHKGIKLTHEKLEALKSSRIEELKQPEKSHQSWILIGYASTVAGGLHGSMVGAHLAFFKKTLPNGEKVSPYSDTDQAHGKNMFYLGILITILTAYGLFKGLI